MRILIVCPYPFDTAPSQRFRFEQYLDILKDNNFTFEQHSFIDNATWKILYKSGHQFAKIKGIVLGFVRRFLLLFSLSKFDYVLLHREASPIGPPIFEWIIAKIFRKKIIYDFDDAIWLANTSEQNKIVAGIKWHQKVDIISKWAYKISAGNTYLCNYARQFNSNVVLNPTTIDTDNGHNRFANQDVNKVIIGWTGTHSTVQYLRPLVPVLEKLAIKYQFTVKVISNQAPDFEIPNLEFLPWNKTSEIDDLATFNIGVMPLTDDKWAQGKCGFKALQYMSLGIPAVISPVGVNNEIVTDGVNGFLCNSENEWFVALETLLINAEKRKEMGLKARERILEKYAVSANKHNFISLFS